MILTGQRARPGQSQVSWGLAEAEDSGTNVRGCCLLFQGKRKFTLPGRMLAQSRQKQHYGIALCPSQSMAIRWVGLGSPHS